MAVRRPSRRSGSRAGAGCAPERTAASPQTATITLPRLDLIRRIEAGQGDFLVFALTPPRLATKPDQAQDIADATIARLLPLDLDGLILYDIDDETDRNPAERPFPFMPTLDPADYLADQLAAWPAPVVVYRAVSKYAPAELRSWFSRSEEHTSELQ